MPPDDEVAVADRGASIRAAAAVREAFTVPDALGVVVGLMEAPLVAGRRVQEEGIATVQLVLALMRNLLALPTDAGTPGGEGPGLRARLLFARRCFEEGVVDVVLLAIQMAQEVAGLCEKGGGASICGTESASPGLRHGYGPSLIVCA